MIVLLLRRMLLLAVFVLEAPIVALDALGRGGCLLGALPTSSATQVGLIGLGLFEALVLAVGAISVLDDDCRLRHLSVVRVLLVPTVVVLDHDRRRPFLVLLLHAALTALVRAVRLLDALCCLV